MSHSDEKMKAYEELKKLREAADAAQIAQDEAEIEKELKDECPLSWGDPTAKIPTNLRDYIQKQVEENGTVDSKTGATRQSEDITRVLQTLDSIAETSGSFYRVIRRLIRNLY